MALAFQVLSLYRQRLDGAALIAPSQPVSTVAVRPATTAPAVIAVPRPAAIVPFRPAVVPVPPISQYVPRQAPPGMAVAADLVKRVEPPPPVDDTVEPSVGMRLTTCSTCGEPMTTPASPPKLTGALDTTTAPEGGATPPATVTEGTRAPGQPKPGGSTAATVLLVTAGVLAVVGLTVWWKRRHKVAA